MNLEKQTPKTSRNPSYIFPEIKSFREVWNMIKGVKGLECNILKKTFLPMRKFEIWMPYLAAFCFPLYNNWSVNTKTQTKRCGTCKGVILFGGSACTRKLFTRNA